MAQPLSIIIVEKEGVIKPLTIKDFKLEELFKKCGFKKGDDFIIQVEWNAKCEGEKYYVEVYGKTEGRANSENKYDFPPPIDSKLFFGNCAVLSHTKKPDGSKLYTNLSLPLWSKIYEKLFGGFEDLVSTAAEDEEEEDELAKVPKEKKTKNGYLKDGFVVDSSSDAEEQESSSYDEEDESEETEETDDQEVENDIVIEDLGSELSEDSYEYDSESK
jgi:hypothetical protein